MATLVHDRIAVAAPRVGGSESFADRLIALFRLWSQRMEERNALAQFGRREMQDIAITATDVMREINKPFWRA